MTNEKAINAANESTQQYGIGSGGVPLLSGTTLLQNKLEATIARIKVFEDAIIFSSGFAANLGVLVGLLSAENIVIHDKLNHASLWEKVVDFTGMTKVFEEFYLSTLGNSQTQFEIMNENFFRNINENLKENSFLLIAKDHRMGQFILLDWY
ncbi:hypothetical protein [uncultured Proteiniphilum sp.]|uniref:hypothetical protein n=1 Tax=uncultured Proteiniphilum sp. TaxID=497637 RepID=UPI00261520F0|nr:hypothetical protein [uncultured Proteiniphilum sp.]